MNAKTLLLAATTLLLTAPLGAQENNTAQTVPSQPVQNKETSETPPAKPDAAPPSSGTPAPGVDKTVVVVATRIQESPYQVAGSTDAVTLDQLKSTGAVSLTDALKYIPGVSVPFNFGGGDGLIPYESGGDRSVNIRGLEGNRVAIITDGIRQPEDFTAGTGVPGPGRVYFDPAVYSQIEIFKSATSSLYGSDALAGTVSTVSVGPELLLGGSLKGDVLNNAFTYASVDNSKNNLVQGAVGNGTLAASVVYSYRDGDERINNSAVDPNPEENNSHAVVGKVLYKLSDAVKLEFTTDYYTASNIVDALHAEGPLMGGMIQNDIVSQDNQRDRLRFSLGAVITPQEDVVLLDELNVLTYWQNAEASNHNVQKGSVMGNPRDRVNHIDYQTEISGVALAARKQFEGDAVSQTLQYGVDFSFSQVSSDFKRIDAGTAVNPPTEMARSDVYRLGLWATDKVELGEAKKIVLTPGLRVDYYDVLPDNEASYNSFAGTPARGYENWSVAPSFSALYRLTKAVNVYGTYSLGVRNPSAEELNSAFVHSGGSTPYVTMPNPDLKNETANSFELGFQGNLENHAFRIAGFYNLYNDFIEVNVDTGAVDPVTGYNIRTSVNRDEVRIYGVEVSWEWHVEKSLVQIDGVRVGSSFTWIEGKQEVAGVDEPLDSVEPWRVLGYVGYDAPTGKWGVRLTGTYVSEKKAGDIYQGGSPVDDYFLLDLVGYYRLNEHWSVNAGINNLTDEKYYTWASARMGVGGHSGSGSDLYTQPGLNGFVSLTATF